MTRQTTEATARRSGTERGFTMVELLVTIVVSALFFAAMVPVFVLASRQNSNDRARVTALDIAQGKIEGIRNLAYARVVEPGYLEGHADIGFGIHWPKEPPYQYTIQYSIVTVPQNPQPGEQQYAVVNVKVGRYDAAHPDEPRPTDPVPVQLRTAVYQQSAGPEIISVDVQPRANDDRWIQPLPGVPLSQVTVSARVNSLDSGRTKTVVFAVYANTGGLIDSSQDAAGVNHVTRSGDVFTWLWDVTSAPDAWYTFTAVALATQPVDYPGNMWQVQYGLNRVPPPPPTWKSVRSGFNQVELAWNDFNPLVLDLRGFVVERSTDGGSMWTRLPLPTSELPSWSRYYIDRNVIPGVAYQYRLYSVDAPGQLSGVSAIMAAPTLLGTAPVASRAPSFAGLPVVEGKSLKLTWVAPTDAALKNVTSYRLYRNDEALSMPIHVEPAVSGKTTYTWSDNLVDWGESYTYRVTAVTDQLAESLPGTVVAPPIPVTLYNLSIQVTTSLSGNQANKTTWRASIVSLDTGKSYPAPSGLTTDQNAGWPSVRAIHSQSGLLLSERLHERLAHPGRRPDGQPAHGRVLLPMRSP